MKRHLGLAVLAAALSCNAPPVAANPPLFPALYSFGDSLSDVGNVFTLSSGKTPISPYFEGRFSNGPNWLDDLSQKLGLGVTPSLKLGNDFAWGGAQTGPTSVNTPPFPLTGLDDQVAAFGTAVPSPKAGALYTLDIGANDISNALEAFGSNPTFDLAGFLAQAVTNTVTAVDTLFFSDHARNLLYYEVPDLGVVPAFKPAGALASMLAKEFNADVLAGLAPLEGKGGLKVFDVPVYKAIDDIVLDPGKFGLTNVTSPCFSGSFDMPGTTCSNPGPDQYLFWDGEHPTAAGHLLTADLAFDVLTGTPVPEPSTWVTMLIGFGGLGLAGWRARRSRAAGAAFSAAV
jgi:phospholipase/lecithinase/hemolysin